MQSFHCKTKTANLCKTSFPLGRSCFRDFLLLGKNLTRNILWTSFEVKKRRISEEYTPRLKISVFCGGGKNFQEFLFKIKNGRPVYLVFVSKTVTFFRLFQSWYEVGMNCPSHVKHQYQQGYQHFVRRRAAVCDPSYPESLPPPRTLGEEGLPLGCYSGKAIYSP